MNNRALVVTIVFAAILLCAAQSYGLVMGPARFEVSLPPGEIADADYYVQNDTENDATIVVEPENWYQQHYDYGKLDIKDWIEFDTYEFTLKPKEIKKLRLRIKVPTDVKGELVAQIFFTSNVLKADGTPTEGIKARLGSILYVAIKGTVIVDAEIKSIAVSNEAVDGKEKLKIAVSVENKGNAHIKPTGTVTIESETGEKVADLNLALGAPALPHQEAAYDAVWDEPKLKAGKYNIIASVVYGKEVEMGKTITLKKVLEIDKDGKAIVL